MALQRPKSTPGGRLKFALVTAKGRSSDAVVMSTQTVPERELWLLNHEIEELEFDVSKHSRERRAIARQAASASRKCRYLKFLRWLRAPAAKYELWSMGVMLTGAFAFGAIGFVLVHFLTSSMPQAF
jgi:hypothetical protein